tara:strand:+ start:62659 stop:62769 length:111 start_codon:yes stop_codon:yes gene_type:complete
MDGERLPSGRQVWVTPKKFDWIKNSAENKILIFALA